MPNLSGGSAQRQTDITHNFAVLYARLASEYSHETAAELFSLCFKRKVNGLICAHEVTTLYYFLNKEIKDKTSIKKQYQAS